MSDAMLSGTMRSGADVDQSQSVGGGDAGVAAAKRSLLNTVARSLGWLMFAAVGVLLAPWRLLRAVRRSMTVSSVSAMLIGIMTLNIIWGYPWTGMFAACISLLVVGMAVNYWLRPRLQMDFSLPAYTPAGHACHIVAHGTNTRNLPAFDFSVALLPLEAPQRKRRAASQPGQTTIQQQPGYFEIGRPGDTVELAALVEFQQRGIHTVPDVELTTTFPFYLFRNRQVIKSGTTIAVTPKPLRGDEDAPARALLQAIGGWSQRLLSGDALDYTGSREYQPGMPVRRWDFSSWARLGRPIVREYQSPSMKSVFLLVDTGPADLHDAQQASELLERTLSLAATAVNDLVCKSIRMQLYITSEVVPEQLLQATATAGAVDSESMQIRLAKAESVEASVADQRIAQVLLDLPSGPTLLLTSRRNSDVIVDLQRTLDVICVDRPEANDLWPEPTDRRGNSQRAGRVDAAHREHPGAGSGSRSVTIVGGQG